MSYTFFYLSTTEEAVVDGAEDVANERANQHENPHNSIATKTRLKAFYM
jgi:hypothetical protein